MAMVGPTPADSSPLPALRPPKGQHSDFTTRYMDLQPVSIVIYSFYIFITTTILIARLIAKVWGTRRLEIEDCQ